MQIQTKVLAAIRLFAAERDVRHYLNGVALKTDTGGKTWLVSTDGHRLGAYLLNGVDGVFDATMPTAFVDGLLKLAKNTKQKTVTLTIADKTVTGSYGVGQMSATLIDGHFPDWKRIVPNRFSGEAANLAPDYVADVWSAVRLITDTKVSVYPDVSVGFNGEIDATLFGCSDPSFLAVIMPIRIGIVDKLTLPTGTVRRA